MINKDEYSWLILLCDRVNEPRRAEPKTNRQAPPHWLKFYEEAIIESEARRSIKEWRIAINNDWVDD